MEVTYTKHYRIIEDAPGLKIYSDVDFKDSLIVWQLLNIARKEKDKPTEEIYDILKEHYKNKTVRSSCHIIKNGGDIEILTKGVFPRFYIEKK